jgi:GTPase SAR1 family protein
MSSNIEYILHCFMVSEAGLAKDIKDNVDDYNNIFSEYILPYLNLKEVNIALIGLTNVGKTAFIESLDGVLQEQNYEYYIYKIYRNDVIINMYEFKSKNMYKNMNKKYTNFDGIILMVDTSRISYFYGLTWFQEMYKNIGNNIPYIFLHNKIDNSDTSLYDNLYHTWNISVKNKYGINESLKKLLNKIN